jgi:ATP-dependent NAD(P)H-hydrate dehydratase
LSETSHKGSSGRVGIVGGNEQYTGAPYYAGMAALNTGAELGYIFTAIEATIPIKCYSPDLMVDGVYTASTINEASWAYSLDKVQDRVAGRVHCLVVGPGMGRNKKLMEAIAQLISWARSRHIYIVLDADALYFLAEPKYRFLLQGYDKAVITPNVVEYKRLYEYRDCPSVSNVTSANDEKGDIGDPFKSVTIVRKSLIDSISVDGTELWRCGESGSLKRAGGIGDVLAGSIGTMLTWQSILHDKGAITQVNIPLACWTACCLVKRASKRAFDAKRRAMSAKDVLDQIGPTMEDMIN